MARLIVGPFNRVEGDLEIALDIADGAVRSARVNAVLFRGFEQILAGKAPLDALVIAPRICGICSVSQSVASASALAQAMGLERPRNGELATNLILACENLADHFTHFYLFFMPDFTRDVYRDEAWFKGAAARFAAVRGSAAADSLATRAGFLRLLGYLAGKWPHTLTLQPGGSARAIEAAEKLRIFALLREFRGYLEQKMFGDALESVAALSSEAELAAWAAGRAPGSSDLRMFLEIADALGLEGLGRATDQFISYGAYRVGGGALFPQGRWRAGELLPLVPEEIAEDLSHSWMSGPEVPLPPVSGVTHPAPDKDGAYSWCKAPRLGGEVVETGALARQMVSGHRLIRDLVQRHGSNVKNRVIARLLELALVVPRMEEWTRSLAPGDPFCHHGGMPEETFGVGMVEAARGSLGHWLAVSSGRIANYQIVAPTTWNFSPRDAGGTPGAVEQALIGAPVRTGESTPVAVQHVVRSFDPCMVCTVH